MDSKIKNELEKYGQGHLLKFHNELDAAGRKELETQLSQIDWEELNKLIKEYVLVKPHTEIPSDLSPAPFFPITPKTEKDKKYYAEAYKKGEELLKNGKVSALTVAGGQGTRLGFDGPKGTYPITPLKKKTLFQYFAETISRIGSKYSSKLVWYIMTSELNDRQTKNFFRENNFFGLSEKDVVFFTQGTMPAIGMDGKLLLGSKAGLALSPNGHGGTLLALKKSGALDRMKKDGVEYISYFQVDNPIAPIADPLFIGLHSLENSEISAKMLPKTNPFEKLGNFCISGGRLNIIEYSDMPQALAEARTPDGSLKFIAGSPAIHMISRSFAEKLTAKGRLELPWHRADKKVPFINEKGELVKPDAINAVKLESFIFDALPLAEKTMILEGCREEEFAPTKNPSGVDSVESCRAMLIARDSKRLQKAGAAIPTKADGSPDCVLELSPRSFVDDADAVQYIKTKGTPEISKGMELYLE